MKKQTIFIVLSFVVVIYVIAMFSVERATDNDPGNLLHTTLTGRIIKYSEGGDGTLLFLDEGFYEIVRKVLVTTETVITDEKLAQQIAEHEVGIEVIVESEYYENLIDQERQIYPALFITPR